MIFRANILCSLMFIISSVSLIYIVSSQAGLSALMLAADVGHTDIVQILMADLRVNVNLLSKVILAEISALVNELFIGAYFCCHLLF